ncbi:MAG TPA: hypothetical protein VGH01_03000 [Jatrophihabitantaceae bacterium]|jgi:hypothetical protein
MSLLSPSSRDQPVLQRSVPWRADDLVRWLSVSALGGVGIVVGWYIAAGEASDSRQVVPLNVAIGGVVLAGFANLTWLLRGWHAVGERRKALLQQLPAAGLAITFDRRAATASEPHSAAAGEFVGAAHYFHRPTCSLARGRSWPPAPLAMHLRAGRKPCGVCRP